ncbi:hypothetical protein E0H39_33210 [Rhizobium leguminosarum bv. viciae]|uniref:hypothetical protein n=1 Tax=Rhizobium leguminosarum TaxID=384 RepID=UPI000E0E4BB8|nr:hypothetical protein [Rhizobium leguminosarum]NEJ80338.1 hypothetical protein [Rhizobium leguminosarum]TBY23723.1 hypothetical protein E0H37_25850 [Rhizobium leguminosarum bv. viciae]TBY26696.1 hypothetical protein E0H30_03980 [Rhizobium leguminosarum bv. viciae]TBY55865.1 hypothetical protein E0H39_33210 [Rhizobium leguminosarum bv. viciae]TBY99401.1 hypothetical protein E0H49_18280 [Rhizobium leguminosarum bv. viciae]
MENSFIQIPDLRSLDKAIRKLGIDCIEGQENGIPVLTVTVERTLFMAMIHNQCLKLMYRLRENNFQGGVAFANHWNAMNFLGTLVPMTDGYVMKYESLTSHGIAAGNLRDTVTLFAASVDKFLDDWFTLTS